MFVDCCVARCLLLLIYTFVSHKVHIAAGACLASLHSVWGHLKMHLGFCSITSDTFHHGYRYTAIVNVLCTCTVYCTFARPRPWRIGVKEVKNPICSLAPGQTGSVFGFCFLTCSWTMKICLLASVNGLFTCLCKPLWKADWRSPFNEHSDLNMKNATDHGALEPVVLFWT